MDLSKLPVDGGVRQRGEQVTRLVLCHEGLAGGGKA